MANSNHHDEDVHVLKVSHSLTLSNIEEFSKIFRNEPEGKLARVRLRKLLASIQIIFSDEDFETYFHKMAGSKDYCTWDDFISFLIFEFKDNDPSHDLTSLLPPIYLPIGLKKSLHKSPIISIAYVAAYSDKKEENEPGENAEYKEPVDEGGTYITASKDGSIKYWSTTFQHIASYKSICPNLKVTSTWVLDIQALSDVKILCVSCTERELRFYDVTAGNFFLRFVIVSVPSAVCRMYYSFTPADPFQPSRLILGDLRGNIRVLEFIPHMRGPFQSKPGTALIQLTWAEVLKGNLRGLKAYEYLNLHPGKLISEVFFWFRVSSIYACAEYHLGAENSGLSPGLVATTLKNVRSHFCVPMGVTTFVIDDTHRILITGGPDGCLRFWDPIVASRPIETVVAHHSGIVKIFVQAPERKVYSLDHKNFLKVWSLADYSLLQNYDELTTTLPTEHNLACYYNSMTRELICAENHIASLICSASIDFDVTDGLTHLNSVFIVLFNNLYKNVVTCGADGNILVWDLYSGRRQILIKDAHSHNFYGEIISVAITAACFDTTEQLLITGSSNGFLKIWNYNNAVCIRNLSLPTSKEISGIVWIPSRILCVSWDQRVTEFPDIEGVDHRAISFWPTIHNDDVMCSAVYRGNILATGSFDGHLILWKIESSQPFREVLVENPVKSAKNLGRGEVSEPHPTKSKPYRDFLDMNRDNSFQSKGSEPPKSIQKLLFLEKRPSNKNYGTLFAALSNGRVQVYSHHHYGTYMGEFATAYVPGSAVTAMATDQKNKFLFTGTSFGYLKTWLIMNYCIPRNERKHVSMPRLRLQFIFLRKERIMGRAKRGVRTQPEPLLVNSFKAHLKAVTAIEYIDANRLIITGSHDCTCRLWTLGGRYLGTFGSPLVWRKISPFGAISETVSTRIPPDLRKVISSTSFRVITGRYERRMPRIDKPNENDQRQSELRKIAERRTTVESRRSRVDKCIYGQPLAEPILGKHFKIPERSIYFEKPVFDTAVMHIPIYAHLKVHRAQKIECPPTPDLLKKTKNLEFMDAYEKKK